MNLRLAASSVLFQMANGEVTRESQEWKEERTTNDGYPSSPSVGRFKILL